MENADQLMEMAGNWCETVLIWIGFGTLSGLAAKGIMPGRDPGGSVVTMGMGIGGTVIGCGLLGYFYDGAKISPISPIGFLVATAGALRLALARRAPLPCNRLSVAMFRPRTLQSRTSAAPGTPGETRVEAPIESREHRPMVKHNA